MALIGTSGPAVVISVETAYYLERLTGGAVSKLRVRARGTNQRVAQELLEIREAAMRFNPPLPEVEADLAEVPAESEQWLSVVQVADLLGLTDRAVRLACSEGRLEAQQDGSRRWRITKKAYEDYRAARAA
jgi:excisionase family DNA binding protein